MRFVFVFQISRFARLAVDEVDFLHRGVADELTHELPREFRRRDDLAALLGE